MSVQEDTCQPRSDHHAIREACACCRSRLRRRIWDYALFIDRAQWARRPGSPHPCGRTGARAVGRALVMGFAITGPLSGPLRSEIGVNKDLAADRTHIRNTITLVASYLGGTEVVIGASLIIGAVVVWRTRDWRLAAVPAIAILAKTAVFLSIASLVNRGRPPVDKLDMAPTSSYRSGHVGAPTALYLAFAILGLRIERSWLRRTTILICIGTPLLVGLARLYRGCTTAPTSLRAVSLASSVRYLPRGGIAIECALRPSQLRHNSIRKSRALPLV